jgi:co-chaperonin GroES (HSP10)
MTEQVAVNEVVSDEEMEQQITKPVGSRVLIALHKIEDKYDSGLIKSDRTLHEERILSTMGIVLDMGAEAYSDTSRFPHGAWCKIGDYVVIRPHTGTRLHVNGQELRLINDDSIEAVVADPRGVTRAI